MSNPTCVTDGNLVGAGRFDAALCRLVFCWSEICRSKSCRSRTSWTKTCGFGQQGCRDRYQTLDRYILTMNPGPSGRVRPDVKMQEIFVINPNAAIQEGWNAQGKLKHLLNRQSRN